MVESQFVSVFMKCDPAYLTFVVEIIFFGQICFSNFYSNYRNLYYCAYMCMYVIFVRFRIFPYILNLKISPIENLKENGASPVFPFVTFEILFQAETLSK